MIALAPYIDGWMDPIGKEITVVPRVKFPFRTGAIPETYTRQYERDYEIMPGSPPRIDQRTAWTNLLTYSEDTDNAAWTKTNLTVTANNIVAPDGLTTMDKLLETTTNGQHSIAQAATVTAAAHEVSIFAKAGLTREWLKLAFTDSAATTFSAFFNVARGYYLTASAGVTAKITNLGNGHYYCVIRFTPAAGAGTFKVNLSTDGSTISYAGTTTAGLYLWGAQVVLGSVAPYVSTTSATRSVLAPDRDPLDPLAYLLKETDPEPLTSQRARITRTFGRIPKTQYVPGSRSIAKPGLAGEFPREMNGVLVSQPDENVAEWTFYTQVAVTSDSGSPSSAISGGTFTPSIGGVATSALSYGASAATVESALDGLAAVSARTGVAVTGGPNQYKALFEAWPTASSDTSGMTASFGTPAFTITYQTPTGTTSPKRQHVRFRMDGGVLQPGSTYTITVLGEETAAIAYDATTQDVEDAINALTVIGSGASVSIPTGVSGGNYSGKPLQLSGQVIDFTVTLPMPSASIVESLTPAGSATIEQTSGYVDGVYQLGWIITLIGSSTGTRTITAPSHSITVSDDIVLTSGGSIVYLSAGTFSVPSSSTIELTAASGSVFFGGAITAVGKANGNRYAADSPIIAVEFVVSHYLPGVTPSIDEASDIVIPARVTPAQLLGAIFGGSTLVNYDVGEFVQWEETAVISMTVTRFNPQLLVSPDV